MPDLGKYIYLLLTQATMAARGMHAACAQLFWTLPDRWKWLHRFLSEAGLPFPNTRICFFKEPTYCHISGAGLCPILHGLVLDLLKPARLQNLFAQPSFCCLIWSHCHQVFLLHCSLYMYKCTSQSAWSHEHWQSIFLDHSGVSPSWLYTWLQAAAGQVCIVRVELQTSRNGLIVTAFPVSKAELQAFATSHLDCLVRLLICSYRSF